MKISVYIGLVVAVFLLACEQPGPVRTNTVEIDGLYTLDLPNTLKPGYNMHPYAGLQYYDEVAGMYVMCIDDMKENLGPVRRHRIKIKGYYNFVELTVFEQADSTALIGEKRFQLNGLEVKTGDYFVSSEYWGDTYELFYRIVVYESENHFFQLVIWMPYEGYAKQEEWITEITRSFRLLHDSPIANTQKE